jgi:hypothetical protein
MHAQRRGECGIPPRTTGHPADTHPPCDRPLSAGARRAAATTHDRGFGLWVRDGGRALFARSQAAACQPALARAAHRRWAHHLSTAKRATRTQRPPRHTLDVTAVPRPSSLSRALTPSGPLTMPAPSRPSAHCPRPHALVPTARALPPFCPLPSPSRPLTRCPRPPALRQVGFTDDDASSVVSAIFFSRSRKALRDAWDVLRVASEGGVSAAAKRVGSAVATEHKAHATKVSLPFELRAFRTEGLSN